MDKWYQPTQFHLAVEGIAPTSASSLAKYNSPPFCNILVINSDVRIVYLTGGVLPYSEGEPVLQCTII